MSETLWLLGGLLGFAILVQLVAYVFNVQRVMRALQNEINASTQALFESRRRTEWLESRLEDLLDAAQRRSDDLDTEWERIDHVTRTIRDEANQEGYRIGLGEFDQDD
jgi:predicted Holliday junction resolvase-like endonuclease